MIVTMISDLIPSCKIYKGKAIQSETNIVTTEALCKYNKSNRLINKILAKNVDANYWQTFMTQLGLP